MKQTIKCNILHSCLRTWPPDFSYLAFFFRIDTMEVTSIEWQNCAKIVYKQTDLHLLNNIDFNNVI